MKNAKSTKFGMSKTMPKGGKVQQPGYKGSSPKMSKSSSGTKASNPGKR